MGINHWPKTERPREKLLIQGAQTLSDAELLAIFLRTGVPGLSALDLSRQLLQQFGGLRGLLNASQKDFCAQHGLGQAKYVQLQAILELSRRHLAEKLSRDTVLSSPDETSRYLNLQLRDRPYEVFCCLYLDNQHRVIAFEELFRGTINSASVHPREVVKQALAHNSAALIIAHNHPSGINEPSDADYRITERIKQALALVEIRLLDHLIIGDSDPVSLAERGLC